MKAIITKRGQITIPAQLRNRLHLEPGDTLVFDENAPFLKAKKTVSDKAWNNFGQNVEDIWAGMSMQEVMEELRGPVELPLPVN